MSFPSLKQTFLLNEPGVGSHLGFDGIKHLHFRYKCIKEAPEKLLKDFVNETAETSRVCSEQTFPV